MEELGPTQLWFPSTHARSPLLPISGDPKAAFSICKEGQCHPLLFPPRHANLQSASISIALDLRGWTSEVSDWHLSNQKGRGTKMAVLYREEPLGEGQPSLGVEDGVRQSNPVTGRN